MSLLAFTREQSARVDQLAQQEFGFSRAGVDGECRPGRGRRALRAGHRRAGGDLLRQGEQCRRRLRDCPASRPPRPPGPRVALGRTGRMTGDAATNYRILPKPTCRSRFSASAHDPARLAELLEGAAWIVDACWAPAPRRTATAAGRGDRSAQRGGRAEAGDGFAQRAGLRHGAARPAHHSRGGNLHVRHCQGWFPGPGGCRLRRSPARARHRRPAQIDRARCGGNAGEQA